MQESTSVSLTARIDDYDEICGVVQLYMDDVAKGDVSKLKEAFHGVACMFGSFLREDALRRPNCGVVPDVGEYAHGYGQLPRPHPIG